MFDRMIKGDKLKAFSGAGTGLRRASLSYAITVFLVLFVHMLYALLFLFFGNQFFFWYNIEICLFYVWMLIMTSRRRFRLVVVLTHLEIITYSIVSVVTFGWDYSFSIFLLVLASMTYLNPFSKERIIFMFSILEAVTFIALWAYTVAFSPIVVLGSDAENIFCYLNYCSCFIGIITASGMSQLSVHSLTTVANPIIYNQVTKAFSRDYFHQCLREILDKAKESTYYLLAVRVVDFPLYREFFGQEKAEEVLRFIGQNLFSNSDYALVGHISSDIFGVVIEKEKFSEDDFSNNLLQIAEGFSNERYQMHIATGVYEITQPQETTTIHCERVRMALAAAVKDCSNLMVRFDEKRLAKSMNKSNIMSEFEKALEKGEFRMFLQPQVERDGTLHGAETLVRWQHPTKGLVSPAEFISVLEDTGMIWRLDAFVWEEAAKCLKKWQAEGKTKYSLSINVSVRDFYQVDLYEHLVHLIEKYEIPVDKLKIEITESVLINDTENKLELIQKLRARGFVVEIDDFGSGYSSLNMLKDFSADVLKVDMIFLRGTSKGDRGRTIIRNVIELAKQLGMSTVVEGVELKEQVEDLMTMGADVFQGTYFSCAIPLDEFEKKYFG